MLAGTAVRRSIAWSVAASLALVGCTAAGSATPSPLPSVAPSATAEASPRASLPSLPPLGSALRFVTLGDGYTAGTDTPDPRQDSWPAQLEQAMQGRVRLRLVDNLAEPGLYSQDIIEDLEWQLETLRPDVVSLLIGVNDVIATQVSLEDYRQNVSTILDMLLARLPPARVFVITTPDYTLTGQGRTFGDPADKRAEIAEANRIISEEASSRGIAVIDISPVSDRVPDDPTLVLEGSLNPSAKQYAGWVEIIGPRMERALTGEEP